MCIEIHCTVSIVLSCVLFYSTTTGSDIDDIGSKIIQASICCEEVSNNWHNRGNYDAYTIAQMRYVSRRLYAFVNNSYDRTLENLTDIPKKIEMGRKRALMGLCNSNGYWCWITRPKKIISDYFFYEPLTVYAGIAEKVYFSWSLYSGIPAFTLFQLVDQKQFTPANKDSCGLTMMQTAELNKFDILLKNYRINPKIAPNTIIAGVEIIDKPAQITVDINAYEQLVLASSFYILRVIKKVCFNNNGPTSILANPYNYPFTYSHNGNSIEDTFYKTAPPQYFTTHYALVIVKHALRASSAASDIFFWQTRAINNSCMWAIQDNIGYSTDLKEGIVYAVNLLNLSMHWSFKIRTDKREILASNWSIEKIFNSGDYLFFSVVHEVKAQHKIYHVYSLFTHDHAFIFHDPVTLYLKIFLKNPKQIQLKNMYDIEAGNICIHLSPKDELTPLFEIDSSVDPSAVSSKQLLEDLQKQFIAMNNPPFSALNSYIKKNDKAYEKSMITIKPDSAVEHIWYAYYTTKKSILSTYQKKSNLAIIVDMLLPLCSAMLSNYVTKNMHNDTFTKIMKMINLNGLFYSLGERLSDACAIKSLWCHLGTQLLYNVYVYPHNKIFNIMLPIIWTMVTLGTRALFPLPLRCSVYEFCKITNEGK